MRKVNLRLLATYFPSIFFIIIVFFKLNTLGSSLNVIAWDTLGYYLYLPSLFIYNNIFLEDTSHLDSLVKAYNASDSFYQIARLDNGNHIFKYSYGISILMAPFYFIADFITVYFSEEKRDGLSFYYQNFIFLGGFIYTAIGALMIPKILNMFFSWKVVIITSIIFLFGTSYFYEASHSNLMPHNLLLALYCLLIFFTVKLHEKYETKYALILGLVFGLLVVCRPTEGLTLLIPLLWNVASINDFKEKIKLFASNKKLLLVFTISSFIIVLPQLIYWKFVGGSWVITSYGNPAEGLDWFSPHTFDVLFSFRKGWFIYTPIALIGVLSFYNLFKRNKFIAPAIIIFFIINLYVVSAWSCWWYASSFSMRALVQSSIILIFPLSSSVEYFIKNKKFKVAFFSLINFLVGLNQFQVWQMERGIINGDRMTAAYYFKIFAKTKIEPEWNKLLLVERSSTAIDLSFDKTDYFETKVVFLSFEASDVRSIDTISKSGHRSTYVNKEFAFSSSIDISVKDITSDYYGWIEGEYWIYPTENPVEKPFSIVYTFIYDNKAYKYRALDSEYLNLKVNEWNKVTFKYLTPEIRTVDDKFSTYVWNRGSQTVYIDDVKVTCFQEKE